MKVLVDFSDFVIINYNDRKSSTVLFDLFPGLLLAHEPITDLKDTTLQEIGANSLKLSNTVEILCNVKVDEL